MNPARRAPQRAAAFLVACLLELLVACIFLRALRPAPLAPGVPVVFAATLQLLTGPATISTAPAPAAAPAAAAALALPAMPDLIRTRTAPAVNFLTPVPPAEPHIDWSDSAKQAATAVANDTVLARERLAASGELPDEAPSIHHATFPWSHQRRVPWLEFDLRTLTTSVHLGRHCELAFVVILPGFGCLLGHLDATARGDLFDPTLLPQPLHLPATPATLRPKPGAPTADDPVDKD